MGWADSIDWGSLATAGVNAAGQIAAQRQAGRERQAAAQVDVDKLNQSAYNADTSAKAEGLRAQDAALLARAAGMLEEQAANRKAGGERASQSVRGDLLANLSDVSLSGLPSRIPKMSFEGGLRPSVLSGNSRALGAELSRAALLDQMKGDKTPFADLPGADFSSLIGRETPGGTALPSGGKLDAILSAINMIGGTGAGLYNSQRQQIPTPATGGQPTTPTLNPATVGTPVAPPGPPPAAQPMLAGRNVVPGFTVPTARTY